MTNHVVSFSGGRTSAYLCHLMIEKFGAENVDIVFMDTGFEHPLTYDFIRNCSKWFKSQITYLRGDFSLPIGMGVGYIVSSANDIGCDAKPFSEMMSKYGTPYIGGMFCTDRMKLKPFKKYCDDKYGKGNYTTWLGIRSDEMPRVLGTKLHKNILDLGYDDSYALDIYKMTYHQLGEVFVPLVEDDIYHELIKRRSQGIKYLAEISDFEKEDILDFWQSMPFNLEIDEHLGNCVFCPKKSNLKLAAAQRDEPELYIKWLEMLYGESVRVDNKTGHWSKMYRGNQSLESLIAAFDGSTGMEIKARIKGAKHLDAGSCSESCEVFSNQI